MIRTRFAPSPTGYLHIGGVRTALFNWLFARQHGGQFILRIDDTDQQRNVEEALAPILDGFRWLGIDWDEGPEVGGDVRALLPVAAARSCTRPRSRSCSTAALAYRDYATAEEIQAEREAAQAGEAPLRLQPPLDGRDAPRTQARFEAEGRAGVVRLKMPRERQLPLRRPGPRRGRVSSGPGSRTTSSSGPTARCLYHLASVVDDHEMQITHVIRAEEHLSNTPRQIFIARGAGLRAARSTPTCPCVAEPGSKNKLSKRKLDKYLKNRDFAKLVRARPARSPTPSALDDLGRDVQSGDRRFLRAGRLPARGAGQLPAAARLVAGRQDRGLHARGDDRAASRWSGSNKAPASFDPQKLLAFQERYMQRCLPSGRVALVLPYLERAGWSPHPPPSGDACQRSTRSSRRPATASRWPATSSTTPTSSSPTTQLPYDEKAFDKRLRKPPEAADAAGAIPRATGRGRAVRRRRRWKRLLQDVRRRRRDQDRPDHPRRARRRHRQGGRLRHVRDAGDPGPGELPGADRPGLAPARAIAERPCRASRGSAQRDNAA